jgi:hypothetical protein
VMAAVLAAFVGGCASPRPSGEASPIAIAPVVRAQGTDGGDGAQAREDFAGVEAKIELGISWGSICARVRNRVFCNGQDDADAPIARGAPLGGIEDATSLAMGSGAVCIATKRGTVHCSGDNRFGQLGARVRAEANQEFVQVAGITDAKRVFAGPWHMCALLSTGRVRCWGRNETGQTGNPVIYTEMARELNVPFELPVDGVRSLAGAFGTSCASTSRNELWCWGQAKTREHTSQRGSEHEQPAKLSQLAGIDDLTANESMFCGVKHGSVVCFGESYSSLLPQSGAAEDVITLPLSGARRVRIANSHGCVLMRDGGVMCFGAAYSGALGRTPPPGHGPLPAEIVRGLPRAIDIAVGGSVSCAIGEALEVFCWGELGRGEQQQKQITPRRIRIE